MHRLVWLMSCLLLLTLACTLRAQLPSEQFSTQSIAFFSTASEEELIYDYIIVTPLASLTPTSLPTLTPTATPTLTPTLNAGSGSGTPNPGVNLPTPPGIMTATPSPTLPAAIVPSPTSVAPAVTPLPTSAPANGLPTATHVPGNDDGKSGDGNSSGGDKNGGDDDDDDKPPTFTPTLTPTPLPTPSVAFGSATYSAAETEGSATITVILSNAYSQFVTVTLVTDGGTAIAGEDYTTATNILTFPPGQTNRSFAISLTDDTDIEFDETVQLTLNNLQNALPGSPITAILTISSDDTDAIVTSSDDADDGFCNVAHCSLREAINTVNNSPGPHGIVFNIAGGGPHTIQPLSPLPALTDVVLIDGLSQPGASCATWPPATLITLDGNSAGSGANGLQLTAGNSTVRGLEIRQFDGHGIALDTVGDNQLECNHITLNNGAGIFINFGVGNQITQSSIFNNNGLGIDLAPVGITINDTGDGDTGPNNSQNYPLLHGVTSLNGRTVVAGSLNSNSNTSYNLEYFANPACHASGNGEGETFLGASIETTNGSGDADFVAILPLAASNGQFVTVKATDPAGNTSEFSPCHPVSAALLASSYGSNDVLRFDGTSGQLMQRLNGGGLEAPTGLTFGPDGQLYVSSSANHQVLRFNGTTGAFEDVFASGGGLDTPIGLMFGPDGQLYVSSSANHQILRFNGTTGAFVDVFASGGGLDTPTFLTFGADNQLYVSSNVTGQILRYNGTTGAFIDVFASGGGLSQAYDLTFGPDGRLYVVTGDDGRVLRYNEASGAYIDDFATIGTRPESRGLAFGPDGQLYLGIFSADNIFRFNGTTGVFIDVFAFQDLSNPYDLVFGP